MTFAPQQVAALGAPLSTESVKRNPRGFDYIEGWRAIAEANRIFGFGEWDRLTEELRQLGEPREVSEKWRVAYFARVRIIVRAGDGLITRDGCGYGSGIDRDLGQAHESAIKEAETDAMKRALMTFGNPFGLALYEKPDSHGSRANVSAPDTSTNPATGRQINPNSAHQAKKDGRSERAVALNHELGDLIDVSDYLAWKPKVEAEVKTWPQPWQDKLWEEWQARLDEARQAHAKTFGADADGVFPGDQPQGTGAADKAPSLADA